MKDLLNFGLINIDKPAGPTSYSISEFVKRQLKLKKTSHMGTLDPKVTGVLPITLGRACKLAGYFIRHDKTYVGILETHRECDLRELQKLIDDNFTGKILQTPPHRSAVKREERTREVFFWNLLEVGRGAEAVASEVGGGEERLGEDAEAVASSGKGRFFLFECRVEGGTYVRKLCSDLGEMIGGAHMGELRRTCAGMFSERGFGGSGVRSSADMTLVSPGFGRPVRLDEFEAAVRKAELSKDADGRLASNRHDPAGPQVAGDASDLRDMIVPAEDAIKKVLPVVEVDKSALKSLYIGRPLFANNVKKVGSLKSVLDGHDSAGNAKDDSGEPSGEPEVGSRELREGDVFAVFCGETFIGVYRRTSEEIIFGRSEFVCN